MYVFPPSELSGVHENAPPLDVIPASDGTLPSRLNITLFTTESDASLTVNDNVLPTSTSFVLIGVICMTGGFGVADASFDTSLAPILFIADTLYVYFVSATRLE